MLRFIVLILTSSELHIQVMHCQDDTSFENIQDNLKFSEFPEEETNSRLTTADIASIKNFLRSMNHPDNGSEKVTDSSAYCRGFHTCYECVKSLRHTCKWCHNFGCTDNAGQLCPFARADNSKEAPALCPYIHSVGPILVPAGERTHIKIKLFGPDPVIFDQDIICQIELKDRLTHLKGLILNDTVHCYPVRLETKEIEGVEIGNVKLIWGGAQPFSNEIAITVYICEYLAMECDTCRMVPPEYGCGWCDGTRSCVTGNKCGEDIIKWTINRLTCVSQGKKMYYV